MGSYTTSSIDNKYKVTQSIGQSGIIGTRKTNSIVVQQGFLTNTKKYSINNSDKDVFEEKLDLILSPNPFIDFIKIDFSRKTIQEVIVQIFDMSGRFIFSEQFQPTESIVIPMKNFAVATYLVIISSGKNNYTKKIIKTE